MAGASDYVDGRYLEQNPGWHVDDSAWKANQILKILRRNNVSPKTIYESGCGAGELLRLLQQELASNCEAWGTDVSPQAIALSAPRANAKLHFAVTKDWPWDKKFFDLVILIDVIAHVEDYRGFLRDLKPQGTYKLIHFALDFSVQQILREKGMIHRRKLHPHLHYFSKTTVMFALNDLGYEIVDWNYTPRFEAYQTVAVDHPGHANRNLLKYPRKVLFALNPELAVKILGGYSLMVLAK